MVELSVKVLVEHYVKSVPLAPKHLIKGSNFEHGDYSIMLEGRFSVRWNRHAWYRYA